MMGRLEVIATAAPILIQDLGRPGLAAIGVPTSGAFDRSAMTLAQRLVGNPEASPGLELTMGARVRTNVTVTAVVTGAATRIRLGTREIGTNEVFSWRADATLTVFPPNIGMRNYLAVRGGFAVPLVLGSASTDLLSHLGPAPLRTGDALALAGHAATEPLVTAVPPSPTDRGRIPVLMGPRSDWFTSAAHRALLTENFVVSPQSNRVGLRLHGPDLTRLRAGELPSEALQRGAIQVPPNGQPIVMGPDHPTTGGYPVIATVLASAWDWLAQLRPGDEVGFYAVRSAD